MPRRARPSFQVTIHVPTDRYTASSAGDCIDFTNDTTLTTYAIGTSG